MFVYNRSITAVLLPLALLLVVAFWSNAGHVGIGEDTAVAASKQAESVQSQDRQLLAASNDRAVTKH